MKILIDARPIINQSAGVGRYVNNLIFYLNDLKYDLDIEALTFSDFGSLDCPAFKGIKLKKINRHVKRLFTILVDMLGFPIADLMGCKYDIIHQTYFGCLPTRKRGTKIISTIHDVCFLSYPELFTGNNLMVSKRALKRQISDSNRFIAISQYTKKELVEKCKVDEGSVDVVYSGINMPDKEYDEQEIEKVKHKYGICKKYLLFIGTIEPRKNIVRLAKAFNMIKSNELQLVIIGKKGWFYNDIFMEIDGLDKRSNIIFTEYVNEHEKGALLCGAHLFVFPSLYEGFGFPILEAMSYGKAVIAGNNSSMPELVEEAGLFVNSFDVCDIKQNIEMLLDDTGKRKSLEIKAIKQAAKFSWLNTAKNTYEVYLKVMR